MRSHSLFSVTGSRPCSRCGMSSWGIARSAPRTGSFAISQIASSARRRWESDRTLFKSSPAILGDSAKLLKPNATAAALSVMSLTSMTRTTGALMMRATSAVLPLVLPPRPSKSPSMPSTSARSTPSTPCASTWRSAPSPSIQESRLRQGRPLTWARYAASM